MNDHLKVLYKVSVFYDDRKSKMGGTAGHRLTLDLMGKCSSAFFSETTNQTESKLDRNVHWMVLYKVYVFCSDIKWKMAATAGLNLTLDPMGKVSQNASSLKPLGQLKPNCPGMIIGRSSTKFMFFYADQKSKMAATAGNRLTLDPMGKCSNAFFSETTIMIKTKLQVCSLDGPLQTLDFLFRYEIQNGGYDRTKFNIGPYGENVSKCSLS
jgi:hypothetical protein